MSTATSPNISSKVYKFMCDVLNAIPLNKHIYSLLRYIPLFREKYYHDLRFRGMFTTYSKSSNFSLKLVHHFDTSLENKIFWQGLDSFESISMEIWKVLVKDSSLIFDVGANTGIYALIAAKMNPNAVIYAFEPSQRTFIKLCKNIEVNTLSPQIKAIQLAVSDKNAVQVFYDSLSGHQYSASLNPNMLNNFTGQTTSYEVKSSSLDAFIESEKIQVPQLLKIDVEMHEPEAIRGFIKSIKASMPTMLIEVLTNEVGAELNDLLGNLGYEFYHIRNNGLHPVEKLQKGVVYHWNYLICRPEIGKKLDHFIEKA